MTFFWERAVHSVNRTIAFFAIFIFFGGVVLDTSHFGFKDRILVTIVPVPGNRLPFTLKTANWLTAYPGKSNRGHLQGVQKKRCHF